MTKTKGYHVFSSWMFLKKINGPGTSRYDVGMKKKQENNFHMPYFRFE